MEKLQNRRNFLKITGLIATASQVPLTGWASGFTTMFNESLNPAGEFSLLKMEELLSGYQFPFIEQFSTSEFQLDYKSYNLYGNKAVNAGQFLLRSATDGKSRRFDYMNWRLADNGIKDRKSNYKYFVSGTVKCKTDASFSPEIWDVSSRIALTDGEPAYRDTGIVSRGKVENGKVNLHVSGKIIKKTYHQEVLSWKWGLPAVVQKMAEENKKELSFSMLDEFDAIYENQILKNKKTVAIDCGEGRPVDFRVFELTGDGIIPVVYWVDSLNRTVFVISGMEAFVLDYKK